MMQFLKDKALGSLMMALLSCGMATSVTAQEADVTTTQEPAGQAEQAGQAAPDAAPAVVRTVSKASSGLPLALLPLQEGVPLRAADPESVVLWPGGARITAHEELTPETSPDGTEAFFVVPAGARDMEISVEGARLLRWSSTPCFLPAQGGLAHERQEAQENLRALRGEQAMLRAVLDTWTKRPVTQPGQDLEQLASRLENRVPALVSRLAQVTDIIAALEEVEKKRPALSDKGQKILLELRDAGASVVVRYRYTLPDCGWQPRYVFDAIPDESGKNASVRVRLEASVRQFSGMDWRKSRLFLALRPHDVVAPPSLPQWVVDDMPQARAMPMMAGAPRQRAMAMKAADAVNEEISLNTEGQDARWEVSTPGLPQGESVVTLRDEIWTAALERVARPDENDGRVWLTAKADLPAGSVWPDGQASFQLEGIPAGERFFAVKDGKAQLFFGVDPRVTVSVQADGRRRGEAGIVNRRRQWSWAWEYTVNNGRSAPVQVRLERPRPHIVDKNVTVTYDDTPKATPDDKDNALFWLLDVPAGGKATVHHGLTITAPADRKINPVAP